MTRLWPAAVAFVIAAALWNPFTVNLILSYIPIKSFAELQLWFAGLISLVIAFGIILSSQSSRRLDIGPLFPVAAFFLASHWLEHVWFAFR